VPPRYSERYSSFLTLRGDVFPLSSDSIFFGVTSAADRRSGSSSSGQVYAYQQTNNLFSAPLLSVVGSVYSSAALFWCFDVSKKSINTPLPSSDTSRSTAFFSTPADHERRGATTRPVTSLLVIIAAFLARCLHLRLCKLILLVEIPPPLQAKNVPSCFRLFFEDRALTLSDLVIPSLLVLLGHGRISGSLWF